MNKATTKVIEHIAKQLPIVMEHSTEFHIVDGEDLIAQGDTVLSNGEKVVAGKKYSQHLPVMIAVNHKRRLTHAFQQRSGEGIAEYIHSINQLIDKNVKQKEVAEEKISFIKSLICRITKAIQSLFSKRLAIP